MLLPKQIWKEIPNYEGKYQVSNTGKVRSLNYKRTGKTKILKIREDKNGYTVVTLTKNSKKKTYSVHRLVAQAFIPNPNDLPEVNHKDENPANNFYTNLEWCTHEYNINYGTHNEKVSKTLKGKFTGENNPFYGNHHTEDTKKKMSENHADFKGENNPKYGKGKPVLMFTLDGEFIRRFECAGDANEYLGKDRNNKNIRICARGKSKTAYGYIWKYE